MREFQGKLDAPRLDSLRCLDYIAGAESAIASLSLFLWQCMSLMVSISGVRGIVGDSLTPEVVVRYSAAFGEYCKRLHPDNPEVVLGRDGRVTGRILTNIISSTLLSTGVNVRAIGIVPTPTIQLAVEHSDAAGGIAVTASHNPIEWNGMKFLAPTGMFLDAEENKTLRSIIDSGKTNFASWEKLGRHTADESWIGRHIEAVLSLGYINPDAIRKRRLKVVADCVNAAGGVIVPRLLKELGCEVIEMNCDVSGVFSHTPEPLPENLTDLAHRVCAEKADLGIAVDPDVDRLVLITEKGEPYGEEYTLASAVQFVLERERSLGRTHTMSVVINLSTTRAVEDIAVQYGARVFRTPVGEINVAKKMKDIGAIIGGEGSGGVILPAIHYGRDAIAGIALILQMLADFNGPLSGLKSTLPRYGMIKEQMRINGDRADVALQRVTETHGSQGTLTADDGLRIDTPEYWVHIRKSNTEPMVRIIAEARTLDEARSVALKYKNLLQ